MSEVVLRVRGKEFGGWTSVSIDKSLYTLTGAFGVKATDIFPGNPQKWGISMGDECSIAIDRQVVITGYIEDIPIEYDANSHNITIGGRDKTGDLVDCSFTETAKEWKNRSIVSVIRALCNPFDVTVDVDSSVTSQANYKIANETFKANEGDTVFDMILKLCKMKGILPVSYGDGKLVLTGTGIQTANDSLELGVNIKSANINQSDKDRFQTYIVKGQGKGKDTKTLFVTAQPSGQYLDEVIRRHRPTVIFTETSCDTGYCKDRARWEALTKAGNSRRLEYEVQGLVQSNGEVWPLNSLVKVKDHFLNIDSTLLISAINYSVSDEQGSLTRLTIVHPDSFKLVMNPTPIKTGFDWAAGLG